MAFFPEDAVIPDKSSACWRDFVTGKKTLQTQILGLQMLLKRIQRAAASTPGDATIQAGADEVHAFFVKFEKILANEIKSL